MTGAGRLTLREACVLTVAILGGEPTAPDVCSFLTRDGWQVSRDSVRSTLKQLRGGPVEVAVQGRGGWGTGHRWRLTEAGRAWLAAEDGA
jgi:hypothetical protein